MNKAKKSQIIWYNERHWAVLVGVLSLISAYFLASRALFTGSLQQYFLTIAAAILGLNRLVHAAIASFRKQTV